MIDASAANYFGFYTCFKRAGQLCWACLQNTSLTSWNQNCRGNTCCLWSELISLFGQIRKTNNIYISSNFSHEWIISGHLNIPTPFQAPAQPSAAWLDGSWLAVPTPASSSPTSPLLRLKLRPIGAGYYFFRSFLNPVERFLTSKIEYLS